jgi:TolA-binding protein
MNLSSFKIAIGVLSTALIMETGSLVILATHSSKLQKKADQQEVHISILNQENATAMAKVRETSSQIDRIQKELEQLQKIQPVEEGQKPVKSDYQRRTDELRAELDFARKRPRFNPSYYGSAGIGGWSSGLNENKSASEITLQRVEQERERQQSKWQINRR